MTNENKSVQKTISEHITLNLEAGGLWEQRTRLCAPSVSQQQEKDWSGKIQLRILPPSKRGE